MAGEYSDLNLPVHGYYQAENAALAIAAVEAFLGGGEQLLHLGADDAVADREHLEAKFVTGSARVFEEREGAAEAGGIRAATIMG